MTKTEGDAAIAMLKRAVERYPNYAPAHSTLAFMMLVSGYLGWREPMVKQAAALAARAAELDNSYRLGASRARAHAANTMRRTDEAVEEFQRAIDRTELRRRLIHNRLALALAGPSDQAIKNLEGSHPHESARSAKCRIQYGAAAAHYLAGRYNEAIGFCRKALQERHGWTGAHRLYVASLAQAGQIDEARTALQRLRELQRNISVAWIEQNVP